MLKGRPRSGMKIYIFRCSSKDFCDSLRELEFLFDDKLRKASQSLDDSKEEIDDGLVG